MSIDERNGRNIEKFKAWCDEIFDGAYDFSAVLDDVFESKSVTGTSEYEVPPFSTKSKQPELYRYEVEEHFIIWGDDGKDIEVDADDDWDAVEEIFIF